jgi:hypothetical protein
MAWYLVKHRDDLTFYAIGVVHLDMHPITYLVYN